MGEIEPRLLGGLEEGLLVSVDVAVRHGGGGKGWCARVWSHGSTLPSHSGEHHQLGWCAVPRWGHFALEPVSGTNLIMAVASGDATRVAAPCGSPQIAPSFCIWPSFGCLAPSSQCKPRSSPCSSCYLSVPVGSKPLAAGDGVVGPDAAQWTREAQASGRAAR